MHAKNDASFPTKRQPNHQFTKWISIESLVSQVNANYYVFSTWTQLFPWLDTVVFAISGVYAAFFHRNVVFYQEKPVAAWLRSFRTGVVEKENTPRTSREITDIEFLKLPL